MLHRRPLLKITWLGLLLALLGATECEELFELQFVSIDGPAEMTFTKAQTVTITASVLEGEGLTVEEVRFYHDDALASTDRTAPYTHAWPITSADNGPHRFHAEALYRLNNGKTDTLQSDDVVYEVDIAPGGGSQLRLLGSVPGVGSVARLVLNEGSGIAVGLGRLGRLGGITVIDVSDPTRPSTASVDLEHLEAAAAIDGSYIYLLEEGLDTATYLAVLDASDPARPRLVSRTRVPGQGSGGIAVEDSLAYLGNDMGLHLVDVGRPADPRLLRSVSTEAALTGEVLVGDGFIVSRSREGVTYFDTTDPRSPVEMDSIPLFGLIAIDGNALYIGRGFDVFVFDLSNPRSATFINKIAETTNDMAIARGRMYVPKTGGIHVFDLSDRNRLDLVDQVALDSGPRVAVSGDLLVSTDYSGVLHVVSIRP